MTLHSKRGRGSQDRLPVVNEGLLHKTLLRQDVGQVGMADLL
jgi:hypothetical protein